MILYTKDNFAPNAFSVRQRVIAEGFTTETGPDGATYTGISKLQMPGWFDLIGQLVGKKITPRLSCFRLNLAGEMPHSWVHSDDICAKWASVLYLNLPEQCKGGTAFWRHKGLDLDRLPSPAELAAKNIDHDSFHRMMTAEWKILEPWERIGMVAMKWNRFITYPTSYFHSRYPFEAFGTGPEDGRLIWICFYDIEGQV